MLKIEIAGIVVSLDNKYSFIEALAHPYLSDKPSMLMVKAEDSEIEKEQKKLSVSAGYAESVVLYSKIAEQLHTFDAFVMHAVVIEMDSVAYLITAKSGVGKTTHARLWLEAFGKRARIINGDKPIIRKIGTELYAAGTPWCGKERLGSNTMARIGAVAVLCRDSENSAVELSAPDATEALIGQLYMPKTPISIASSLSLLDELVKTRKVIKLGANMDVSAATVAYSAMSK